MKFKKVDEVEHKGYFIEIGARFVSNSHDISTGIFDYKCVDTVYFKVKIYNPSYEIELESEGGSLYSGYREDLMAFPQKIITKKSLFKKETKHMTLQESYEERIEYIKDKYKKTIESYISEDEKKKKDAEITDGLPDSLKYL